MKIQTNAGDVELTAEMVCRGMVFWSENYCPEREFTTGRPEGNDGCWRDAHADSSGTSVLYAQRFLGCDPTLATRADCERFGVHGDAAAHGFAKIPAGGAIDLTVAENVRKGMLFRINGREVVAACDAQFAVAGSTRLDLLGCHPALARREDCERFGIPERCEQFGEDAPLDAAAHGFARLKTGGAVDLRHAAGNLPVGSVYAYEGDDSLCCVRVGPAWLPDGARLVGLSARYASPADVERLCCGEVFHGDHGGCGERCTLAIGDHETHEDIAQGVKWPAKVERYEYTAQATSNGFRFTDPPHAATDKIRLKPYTWGAAWYAETEATVKESARRLAEWEEAAKVPGTAQNVQREAMRGVWADTCPMPPCAKCGGSVGSIMNAVSVVLADANRSDGWRAHASVCMTCAGIVGAKPNAYEIRDGRIVEKRVPLPSPTFRGMPFPEQTARKSPPCKCGALGPDIADHLHAKGCAVVRHRQEAPLLALVAAVPEGLNPIGWRAAVLAVDEMCKVTRHVSTAAWKEAECEEHLRAFVASRTVPEDVEWGWGMQSFAAVDAYRRAIAPHKAPPPERKRGPRLTVDDGRDE